MHRAFLLLGGNLGNRELNLATARQLINEHAGLIRKNSSIYETAAWGKTDQPAFLNQALEIQTRLSAKQLLHQLLELEKKMGRTRDEKFGPRTIDMDILLFDEEKHQDHSLTIPHPEMQRRRFALLPLAEIAADLLHPVLNKTIVQLLQECSDNLDVRKYS